MAAHKREGPATCLLVLGIVIDSADGQLRLPADKLDRLNTLLKEWGGGRGGGGTKRRVRTKSFNPSSVYLITPGRLCGQANRF